MRSQIQPGMEVQVMIAEDILAKNSVVYGVFQALQKLKVPIVLNVSGINNFNRLIHLKGVIAEEIQSQIDLKGLIELS